jgi:hypothetical protein
LYKCSIYTARKSPIGDLCKKCKTTITSIKEISEQALNNVFIYNEITGELTHKHTTVSGVFGELATHSHSRGYLSTMVGKKSYLAHRVIYLMKTGELPEHIDHINHIKHDNSWRNLRKVTQTNNNKNMPLQTNTPFNSIGVNLHKPTGKYRAYISISGKSKHLGLFETVEAAVLARQQANIKYGYHANHGK